MNFPTIFLSEAANNASFNFLFAFTCFFTGTVYSGEWALPERRDDFLIDDASVLSADENHKMRKYLEEVELIYGVRVVILIMEATPVIEHPELDIDEYGKYVYHSWGLSDENKGKSALILVSMKERKIRIDVTDARWSENDEALKALIKVKMTPRFRQEKYLDALKEGSWITAALITGQYSDLDSLLYDYKGYSEERSDREKSSLQLWITVFFIGTTIGGVMGLRTYFKKREERRLAIELFERARYEGKNGPSRRQLKKLKRYYKMRGRGTSRSFDSSDSGFGSWFGCGHFSSGSFGGGGASGGW